jgi:hypothetical protein
MLSAVGGLSTRLYAATQKDLLGQLLTALQDLCTKQHWRFGFGALRLSGALVVEPFLLQRDPFDGLLNFLLQSYNKRITRGVSSTSYLGDVLIAHVGTRCLGLELADRFAKLSNAGRAIFCFLVAQRNGIAQDLQRVQFGDVKRFSGGFALRTRVSKAVGVQRSLFTSSEYSQSSACVKSERKLSLSAASAKGAKAPSSLSRMS